MAVHSWNSEKEWVYSKSWHEQGSPSIKDGASKEQEQDSVYGAFAFMKDMSQELKR